MFSRLVEEHRNDRNNRDQRTRDAVCKFKTLFCCKMISKRKHLKKMQSTSFKSKWRHNILSKLKEIVEKMRLF
jgi:hypothetical protein